MISLRGQRTSNIQDNISIYLEKKITKRVLIESASYVQMYSTNGGTKSVTNFLKFYLHSYSRVFFIENGKQELRFF